MKLRIKEEDGYFYPQARVRWFTWRNFPEDFRGVSSVKYTTLLGAKNFLDDFIAQEVEDGRRKQAIRYHNHQPTDA